MLGRLGPENPPDPPFFPKLCYISWD